MGTLRSRFNPTRAPSVVAGVDLGSNSFHLMVARAEEDGHVHVLDRLRDPVRLAAGLDVDGNLRDKAVARGVKALRRFGERLHDMPPRAVRAVSTNTLRKARNGAEVEEAFCEALGHNVEIISGPEEARLIYSGVSHTTAEVSGRLLVLDIGGGSTECIIGRGFEPVVVDSLYMGCIGYTERFFPDGKLSEKAFERARLAAGLELTSIVERYREIGWDTVLGSSGTIHAVHEVLRSNGWAEDAINGPALEQLERELVARKRVANLELPGLDPERASIFAGGVAILSAAVESLGVESLKPAAGALREGLVYELLGRVREGDPRDATVARLTRRYKIDRNHATRVASTAADLFEQANARWKHEPERALRLLEQASALHEIGLSIAYAGHQKHGAYILRHADLPGFSLDEQLLLSAIVSAHRRNFSQRAFDELPKGARSLALHLTLMLRLAVRLHHSRGENELPKLQLRAKKARLELALPRDWLARRPLTRADLAEEANQLEHIGIELRLA